jgi:Cys-rich four helix bundle protein (predicted Tat secretion target)
MQRRNFVQGGAVAALAVAAEMAVAQPQQPMDHSKHMHNGNPQGGLAHTAAECVLAGQACIAHCLILLGNGDTSVGECAKSVNQMLAVCGALQSLASQQSKYTAGIARVAYDLCLACEKECRKHEDKHAECKNCANACAACAKDCKALIG